MATIPLGKAEWAMALDGGPCSILHFEEGASQSFVTGEPVMLTAGYVVECGDNPVAILGIALADAHNTSAGLYKIPVALADHRNIFRANCCSSAGTRAATALTMIGKGASILRDTTNSMLQILSTSLDGSNSRVTIMGLDPQDVVGDTGGRLLVKFKQPFCQLAMTS